MRVSPNQIPDLVINTTRRAWTVMAACPAGLKRTIRKRDDPEASVGSRASPHDALHVGLQKQLSGFRIYGRAVYHATPHGPTGRKGEAATALATGHPAAWMGLRCLRVLYIFTV
jgi:hypothetical protein